MISIYDRWLIALAQEFLREALILVVWLQGQLILNLLTYLFLKNTYNFTIYRRILLAKSQSTTS